MPQRPTITRQATIEALLDRSKRPNKAVPIRRAFLQQGTLRRPEEGPLATLVRRHDMRALDQYLLLHAAASADPWNVDLPAATWARAMGLPEESGVSAVSKTWRRLEGMGLVARTRKGRLASLRLLREDGSGKPYTHPGQGSDREPYLKLPYAYWTDQQGWYRTLDLPAKAMLLIALSLRDDFILPTERAWTWYGLSPDTAERGLRALRRAKLLHRRHDFKVAPLSATGVTDEYHYTLKAPFGPRAGRRTRRRRTAT
jgi:hypothetical protein